MTIKPMKGFLLVKPEVVEQKTASGIVLPKEEKAYRFQGEVIAVGEYEHGEPPVKEGDIVMWKKFTGEDVYEGNLLFKLLSYKELLAILI